MASVFARSGRRGGLSRAARAGLVSFVIGGAIVLAGCTSGASAPHASSVQASTDDVPPQNALGEAQRWCGDEEWLVPAAGLYVSAYGKARHPIEPKTIKDDLASGGTLWRRYQRLAGEKSMPARLDLRELREFLVALADVAAVGTDPVRYARHVVATCDS